MVLSPHLHCNLIAWKSILIEYKFYYPTIYYAYVLLEQQLLKMNPSIDDTFIGKAINLCLHIDNISALIKEWETMPDRNFL